MTTSLPNRSLRLPVIVLVACLAYGYVPPTHGGFYCDDPSIGHKRGDDSFSTTLLLTLALVPILLVIFLVELSDARSRCSEENDDPSWSALSLSSWRRTRGLYGHYFTCCGFTLLVNEALKTLVAEPRPHFLDTCRPDWAKVNCSARPDGFVSFEESHCTEDNTARGGVPRAIYDAMKSFPSGHAQISWYAAVFAIIYLQIRLSTTHSNLLRVWVQLLYLFYASSASLTRISDRRHHWWDVLAGALLGAASAYLAAVYWCQRFRVPDPLPSSDAKRISEDSLADDDSSQEKKKKNEIGQCDNGKMALETFSRQEGK